MAEGYLRHAAGDAFESFSAGTEPKGLNPLAVEAMREIGIDISHQTSKSANVFLGQDISYVITVCDNAKQRCPIFPGTGKSCIGALTIRPKHKARMTKDWRCFAGCVMKLPSGYRKNF